MVSIINLSKLTTKELKSVLDNLIQEDKLLEYIDQLLDYKNYRRICLLDKENRLKYNTNLFQTLENDYAFKNDRIPANFKIDDACTNGANVDCEENTIRFTNLFSNHYAFPDAIYAFTFYPNCFKHENFHLDDFKFLKYQKSNDTNFCNYQSKMQKHINKIIGLTLINNELKNNVPENDLKIIVISQKVDEIIEKKQKELTVDEVKFYTYLNPKELRPRISEFAVIPNTIERINQVSDLDMKFAMLQQVKKTINSSVIQFYKQTTFNNNKLMNKFFKFVETEMTKPFSKGKIIYDKELFETKTMKLLEQTYELGINTINNINKQIKEIENTIEDYTINPIYNNLKDSVEYITNNKTDAYKLLRVNPSSTLNYLKLLNDEFNLNYIKYSDMLNKSKDDTNIKFLTDKLYEIYNEIDNYVYDVNINQQLKENIQNIFINIFIKEENVYLIDSAIQEGIYNIVLQETELNDNLKELLQIKIDDLDYLKHLQNFNKEELIKETIERYGLDI